MTVSDSHPRAPTLVSPQDEYLSPSALLRRLDEEIGRAERHGTGLSCLLVAIELLDEAELERGGELHEHMLDYAARALQRELRRFDRVGRPSDRELLIVLPGADGPSGETVARRVLERLRTIKVESGGTRSAPNLSVGLAAWRERSDAADLLRRTSAAAHATCTGDADGDVHAESAHARLETLAGRTA